jgi:small subunit ribosomal protein S20
LIPCILDQGRAATLPGLFHGEVVRSAESGIFAVHFRDFSMANHKSSIKRIRQSVTRNERNRYQHKTTRNAVRDIRASTDKKEAVELLPKVSSMLDKLAKRNIIHKNKASNLKSSLKLHVDSLK